jgi:H+-transporting ATPase
VLFLAAGLLVTGNAIVTPVLMVFMMVTGDFLAMSSSTDNVRPSPKPSVWRVGNLTRAGLVMGVVDLTFCVSCLAVGKFALELNLRSLQTFAVVTLVFSGQALFYVARERDHLWSSRPGNWLVVCSLVDVGIVCVLAGCGILMTALPFGIVAALFLAASGFAFLLDTVKLAMFRRFPVA